ncbi:MAG: hypothetical protein IPK81_19385 [Rhodospirillales bacterium]|nr:MAG: hypothetical protein IPK81_19385 [Rhodospirillales bacterium]
MPGTTLVRTTLTGLRPLGVRGEPLHHAQEQIRGVVRRRLGERHHRVLAEPEPHALGGRIDWYSDAEGPVRALAELPPHERDAVRADIDRLMADIDKLGATLEAGSGEDARLAGRSLRMAATRPADEYLFMVGDQPVVVCWGYETGAAGAVLPAAFLPGVAGAPAAAAAPAVPPPFAPAPFMGMPAAAPAAAGAAAIAATPFPWLRMLLVWLLAFLLGLFLAWVLRQMSPMTIVVAGAAAPDPTAGLNRDMERARAEDARLRAILASLRDDLQKRRAQCVAPAAPPRAPAPPATAATKPDGMLRLPDKPTQDMSFLKGCWRGDSFRYTPRHNPGAHTYCFDEKGKGKLTFHWSSGSTCEAPATARYEGGKLLIVDADSTCSDGAQWTQDRLVCVQGADKVAQCSGETNIHLPEQGITRERATGFTVRLHRQ